MFYSIDLLSPKGALGNVWVMRLLFRDAIFVRVGSFHAFYSRAFLLLLLLRVFKKTCGFASADDDETFSLSL